MREQKSPETEFHARKKATLEAFAAAWARCDIDTLMELVGEAPVYRTSGGLVFEGRDEVRRGFAAICKPAAPGAPPAPDCPAPHFFDNKCLTFWSLALSDGEPPVAGIDIITFDAGARISSKDAYRKLR